MQYVVIWFELFYYIAFICLTTLIVLYAKKTYLVQTKKESNIFCKLYIPESEHGKVEQLLYLEIYNYGNEIAKKIVSKRADKEIAIIDFIKPSESYNLLFGSVLRMIGCNRVFMQDDEISSNEVINIELEIDHVNKIFHLNTSTLFLQSEIVHNELENIANNTKEINLTLGKAFDCHSIGPGHDTFRDELNNIAHEISKLKH